MKETKRSVLLIFAVLVVIFSLVGCTGYSSHYSSHYSAVGHVHSNDSDSAWVSFMELEGREVFTMKCKGEDKAKIRYSGKLETGSLTVYYDCGENKTELFSLNAGDEINADSDEFTADTVYIIIETNEKCLNGILDFEIQYD